jgi:hypothetical protein
MQVFEEEIDDEIQDGKCPAQFREWPEFGDDYHALWVFASKTAWDRVVA